MKENEERQIYIKYRTLCPIPEEYLEQFQTDTLDLSYQGLMDISFLRKHNNLRVLSLRGNDIQDISALMELECLEELDLSDNPIVDFTPITKLSNLKKLNLEEMKIQDMTFLSQLNNLEELYMCFDGHTRDYVPLAKLKKLRKLYLWDEKLEDADFLTGLEHLEEFVLNSNDGLKNCSALGTLSNLKVLRCKVRNNVRSISFVKNLTKLEELHIHGMYIQSYKSLGELSNLRKLDLSNNDINDIQFLNKLQKLEELNLKGRSGIKEYTPLSTLYKLRKLNLNGNRVKNIDVLSNLRNLEELDLSNNKEIADYRPLMRLKKLKKLELEFNGIQNIQFLESMSNLEELNLRCNHISDIGVLSKLTKLKVLDLSGNSDIETGKSLENLVHLNKLRLGRTGIVYREELGFLKKLAELEELELVGYNGKNYSFLDHLPQLKKIDLSHNDMKELDFLAKLPNLEELNLSYNKQLKTYNFPKNLYKLKRLKLQVNELENIDFLQKLLHLEELDLSYNELWIEEGVLWNFPRLRKLDLNNTKIHNIEFLSELGELRELQLGKNEIENIQPLAGLKKLRMLRLANNPLCSFDTLRQFPMLKDLTVNPEYGEWANSFEKVDDEIKDDIFLDLSSQNLEDISFLKNYKNLKVLSLRRNKIKDISVLAGLVHLEELDLSYNQIQDFSPLRSLKHLKKIAPQKLNEYLVVEEGPEVTLQLETREPQELSMYFPVEEEGLQWKKTDNGWYKKIKNPRIEKNGFIFKKTSVTWDCITFGSYPQGKVSPMRQQVKNKLIEDTNYQLTYSYKTDSGQEERYCKQSYNYYKYEPIRWRVLHIKNGKALLFADKILDAIPLDTGNIGTPFQWKNSFAYRYLNSEGTWANNQMANSTFLKMAFSKKEREAMIKRDSGYVSLLSYSAISDVKFASYGLFDLFSRNKLSIDPLKTQIFSDYAEAKKLNCSKKWFSTGEMSGTAPWWLETALSDYSVYFVENTGKINGAAYLFKESGIRPVVEVDLTMLDEADVQITTVTV